MTKREPFADLQGGRGFQGGCIEAENGNAQEATRSKEAESSMSPNRSQNGLNAWQ